MYFISFQSTLISIGFISKVAVFVGPPKIFDVQFFQFFEKQIPKLTFWDLAYIKRNKVRNFGKVDPDLVTAADRFMLGGA